MERSEEERGFAVLLEHVRSEVHTIADGVAGLHTKMDTGFGDIRTDMTRGFADVRKAISALSKRVEALERFHEPSH